MSFNADPLKHAQEIILRRKIERPSDPPLVFNTAKAIQTHC